MLHLGLYINIYIYKCWKCINSIVIWPDVFSLAHIFQTLLRTSSESSNITISFLPVIARVPLFCARKNQPY